MSYYRVSFYKYLVSSDGHPTKALQAMFEVRGARNADRAIKVAQRRYERQCAVDDWTLHADEMDVQVDGVGPQPEHRIRNALRMI